MNETIFNRLVDHIQSKGIIISDIKRLERYIVNNNYNRVMKPYLKLIPDKDFKEYGVTTDDLLNLYELDSKTSMLFLDAILCIEKKLNTDIAYTIEDTYKLYDGCLFNLDKDFIKNQIFSNCTGPLCGMSFEQLLSKMTKYAHINPNTNSYENISRNNLFLKWKACPLDALCLTWTFSTTVLSYFALNDHLKKKIIRHFKVPSNNSYLFDSIINDILDLRNQITHNNILFGHIVELQSKEIVKNFNEIFRTRKQYLDLYDFAILLEYLSGQSGINDELKRIIKFYTFSSDRIQKLVDSFILGAGNER